MSYNCNSEFVENQSVVGAAAVSSPWPKAVSGDRSRDRLMRRSRQFLMPKCCHWSARKGSLTFTKCKKHLSSWGSAPDPAMELRPTALEPPSWWVLATAPKTLPAFGASSLTPNFGTISANALAIYYRGFWGSMILRITTVVFTVRLHVMQRTVLLSEFCPSVRPSDACIVTKLNNALRIFWYHTKGQSL